MMEGSGYHTAVIRSIWRCGLKMEAAGLRLRIFRIYLNGFIVERARQRIMQESGWRWRRPCWRNRMGIYMRKIRRTGTRVFG